MRRWAKHCRCRGARVVRARVKCGTGDSRFTRGGACPARAGTRAPTWLPGAQECVAPGVQPGRDKAGWSVRAERLLAGLVAQLQRRKAEGFGVTSTRATSTRPRRPKAAWHGGCSRRGCGCGRDDLPRTRNEEKNSKKN